MFIFVFLGKSCIIDSGTTFTYLPRTLHKSIRTLLGNSCATIPECEILGSESSDICVHLQNYDFKDHLDILDGNFPHFDIRPDDVKEGLPWLPRSYFYQRNDPHDGVWCVGIEENHSDSSVLGMSFFKHSMVIIDRENHSANVLSGLECPSYHLNDRDNVVLEPSFDEIIDNIKSYETNNNVNYNHSSEEKMNNPHSFYTTIIANQLQKYNIDDSSAIILGAIALSLLIFFIIAFLRMMYLRYMSKNSTIANVVGLQQRIDEHDIIELADLPSSPNNVDEIGNNNIISYQRNNETSSTNSSPRERSLLESGV